MYKYVSSSFSQLLFIAQVIFGVVGLTIASQINIPLQPVPINMGTIAVMIIGLQYSFSAAFNSSILYLLLGIAGAPLFNNFNGGIIYFFGPTGGYLLGYFLAASVMSFLQDRGYIKSLILLCIVGQLTIFTSGMLWLAYLKGLSIAWQFGFMPFILPGICKICILVSVVKIIRR